MIILKYHIQKLMHVAILESSSVRYGIYQKLVGDLGLDVILSNPYLTCLITKSKKKIDRLDA